MYQERKKPRETYIHEYRRLTTLFESTPKPIPYPVPIDVNDPITRAIMANIVHNHFNLVLHGAELTARMLQDDDPGVRLIATGILNDYFERIPDSQELLASKLNDNSPEVKRRAIGVLGHHFDQIPNAALFLIPLTKDRSPEIRELVLDISAQHLSQIPEPFSWIENFTRDPSKEVRLVAGNVALFSLSQLVGFEKVIEMVWTKGSAETRFCLMACLYALRNKIPNTQFYVEDGLKDPDPSVRFMALFPLGRLFYTLHNSLPLLREALEDDSPEVRDSARWLFECYLNDQKIRANLKRGQQAK